MASSYTAGRPGKDETAEERAPTSGDLIAVRGSIYSRMWHVADRQAAFDELVEQLRTDVGAWTYPETTGIRNSVSAGDA